MELSTINTSEYCLNFTARTANIVLKTKASLMSASILANLVAIAFIFVAKRYKDFLYRLMLYLMVTDILQAIATMAITTPVNVPEDGTAEIKEGQYGECIASGFFSMATMWMGNIVFFWISLCLAYRGWCLYRHLDSTRRDRMENAVNSPTNRLDLKKHIKEIVGVLILFIAPFAVAVIPLFVDHESYGLSGLWCWIKVLNHACGDLRDYVLILYLLVYYGPMMIIVLLAVAFFLVALLCYCRGEVRRNDKDRDKKERYIKEIVILLPLPVLYWMACTFLLANRIYSTVHDHKHPVEPLWIAHAVADSLRSMLPAVAFLLHPCVWKDRAICFSKCPNARLNVDTDSTQETLTHPGYQNRGYGSCNTSSTDSIFEN